MTYDAAVALTSVKGAGADRPIVRADGHSVQPTSGRQAELDAWALFAVDNVANNIAVRA